ncbi:MAG: hypothetical protein AAB862_02085 [Patescibacteria group bacterium]
MLEYNEIRGGKYILYNNEPFEVLESHVARTQQRKPQNQTKLRSLLSGRVVSATFHASDKVTEADIGSKKIKFLYHNRGEFWFCEINDPSRRFSLEENLIGEPAKFLKGNTMVDALTFTEDDEDEPKIIRIKLPIKVELAIKDAPPGIKGNTASGGGKSAILETGTSVTVPFFVNVGDIIRVNTETGEYVERVSK